MRRAGLLAKGIGALVLLVLLLVGVPLLLVRTGGMATADGDPVDRRRWRCIDPHGVPSSTLLKAVAVVVWLAWLQLVVSVVTEVVAAWRGRRSARSRPPSRPFATSPPRSSRRWSLSSARSDRSDPPARP